MPHTSPVPRKVREIDHTWIRLSDGCRVAARIWLPEDADDKPVPAILEYLPYRIRDGTRARDSEMHPYFAAHGYASVRVDIRGTGDSDGVMHDEYLKQEQDDGLEILAWIAEQPWCTGAIGMIGISWGGFNGLQIAARQPDELKAIITVCSTDDRFADDVHYMGGTLLSENLSWASTMLAFNSRPPDPVTAGADWREKWLDRLDKTDFWQESWLEHQQRDGFWKHGSVNEDFSAIQCPVFAVGGWADGYSNAIPRLLENLDVPRLGLIGPWGHTYPHQGVPGPKIAFLQESLRWWDRWLKGIETGIMDEPQLRAWMQDSVPPATAYDERPGRWVAEDSWPPTSVQPETYSLQPGRLSDEAARSNTESLSVRSPLTVGQSSGKWFPYNWMPDLPSDQNADDHGSLVFETDVLQDPVEILGAPVLHLEFASDRPVAHVAVRLSDVAPSGAATRVTYGLLNLTHLESHEHPQALEPGKRYTARVQLNDIAQHFPAGHRIRLAVSTNYWPVMWPAPEPVTLDVFMAGSSLVLPVRPASDTDRQVTVNTEPAAVQPLAIRQLSQPEKGKNITRDLVTGVTTMEILSDSGFSRTVETGLTNRRYAVERYSFDESDPASVRGETEMEFNLERDDWKIRTVVRTSLTSTATHFKSYAELDAFEGDERVFSRTYSKEIPRKFL